MKLAANEIVAIQPTDGIPELIACVQRLEGKLSTALAAPALRKVSKADAVLKQSLSLTAEILESLDRTEKADAAIARSMCQVQGGS